MAQQHRSPSHLLLNRTPFAAAALIAAASVPGCGTSKGPQDLSPQSVGARSPIAEAGALAGPVVPSSPSERAAGQPSNGPPVHSGSGQPEDQSEPTTIVIGARPTGREATASTLQAASRSERVRRARAEQPVAVITDENLAEFAEGANVTVGSAPPALSDELRGELEQSRGD